MNFESSANSASDGESQGEPAVCSTILKTPEKTPNFQYRQNTVSTVVLAGVPIVSLLIDAKERLCLAQISNTLLKQFSYNEIHNRRVALGITCVQCTPVQLEILRRAGAMPISSRRCGMITKREAERLVKSFLEDNRPPKLPDNFFFEVFHNCGWGCKGKFEPSRYNSSRAKCIRCNLCNLYFSPNKFIFHFHRTADAKYNHPDAANFNSWRRHLHLVNSEAEDIFHAWEDVKAMFNGGSRKRTLSSPGFPEPGSPASPVELKRPKITEEPVATKPNFVSQYQNYPMFSMPGKNYSFNAMAAATANTLPFHYQFGKTDVAEETKQHPLSYNPWRQPQDFFLPTYDLLWASQFSSQNNHMHGLQQHYINSSPVKELSATDNSLRQSPSETHSSSEEEETTLNSPRDNNKHANHRPSAFRPVGKNLRHDNLQQGIPMNSDKPSEPEPEPEIDVEDDPEPVGEERVVSKQINDNVDETNTEERDTDQELEVTADQKQPTPLESVQDKTVNSCCNTNSYSLLVILNCGLCAHFNN